MSTGRKAAAKSPRKSAAARRIAAGQAAAEAAVESERASAGTRRPRATRPEKRPEKMPDNIPAPVATGAPKWRDVLGDELARRVALAAAAEGVAPAAFALAAVETAVSRVEVTQRVLAEKLAARGRCSHPEKDRRGMRCGACGARGLPAAG